MKEWLYRAIRTFIQAASGYLAANLIAALTGLAPGDLPALRNILLGLIASSVAAGIAAVMNRTEPEAEQNDEP